jgi:ABC-type multidrug transport system ATPase subunit
MHRRGVDAGMQSAFIPPMEPPLEARGLVRTYGRLTAVAGLSLTLAPGECVALIGANGSGKSTAVGMITGSLTPTEGSVAICGADPHREPEAQRARASVAVVPDTPVFYEDLTVRQHLELVALAHDCADDGLDGRIDQLLEALGLTARGGYLPHELSRGMRQKTQLACALVRPMSLFVLDEPVVGLDPPSQTLLAELLVAAKGEGVAVLFSTHQLGFADGIADRGIVLEEGKVIDEGPWGELTVRAGERGWRSR